MAPKTYDAQRRLWTLIFEIRRTYGFSARSAVWCVQKVIKDLLAVLASAGRDETSFADINEIYGTEQVDLEKWLAPSEEKLADAERRTQTFEHKTNTTDDVATKIDDAEANLKCTKDQFCLLEDKVFELSKQLIKNDASSSGYREPIVVLEKIGVNISAEAESLKTQHMDDKDLLDGVCTTLGVHKTGSQQHVAADAKDRKALLADKVAMDTKLYKFPEDMQTKSNSIQVPLEDEVKRAKAFDSEPVKLLFSRIVSRIK